MGILFNGPHTKSLFKFVAAFLLFGVSLLFLLRDSVSREWYYKLQKGSYSLEQLDDDIFQSRFDDGDSCHSRHNSLLHKLPTMSPDLVSKIRSYETRHQICGPHTYLYNMSIDVLKNMSRGKSECKYIVWTANNGLGNRMISIVSTFLYALLTDRILLIQQKDATTHLFCEPFPKSSWLVPSDFPLSARLSLFHQGSKECFGELLRNDSSRSLPQPYIYIHLLHDYNNFSNHFFCDEDQSYIHDVPWLIVQSNQYFVPSLFSVTSFEEKLHKLFPDKERVFHILARYLFNPSNSVWGLVRRFYDAYLSDADLKVGIQIRAHQVDMREEYLSQILLCTKYQGLLPSVYQQDQENLTKSKFKKKKISVLITSLSRGYSERVKNLYWEHETMTGETIAVHQPSFEEHQALQNLSHDQKALAEVYLLSLSDKIITSHTSTFGYVAQGLGGLTPWILSRNMTDHYQPCRRDLSMEPCFHVPPHYDCKMRSARDRNITEPHTIMCIDGPGGIKLVNNHDYAVRVKNTIEATRNRS